MLIADFGFGDYDTDAVRAFLLMYLVGVASVRERSTVLVVLNVLYEYVCVCSLSSSNAVANEFDRASTSISIWGVATGKAALSFHTNLHCHITSHHPCQFFCNHHVVLASEGWSLAKEKYSRLYICISPHCSSS